MKLTPYIDPSGVIRAGDFSKLPPKPDCDCRKILGYECLYEGAYNTALQLAKDASLEVEDQERAAWLLRGHVDYSCKYSSSTTKIIAAILKEAPRDTVYFDVSLPEMEKVTQWKINTNTWKDCSHDDYAWMVGDTPEFARIIWRFKAEGEKKEQVGTVMLHDDSGRPLREIPINRVVGEPEKESQGDMWNEAGQIWLKEDDRKLHRMFTITRNKQ